MNLIFVTGNKNKITEAAEAANKFGISIRQETPKLLEMQSDDVTEIAISKATQAFELLKQPLFVNDSGWNIPALDGFPGALMSYVNKWFGPQDFINLIKDKEDKSIILEEVLVYMDKNGHEVFSLSREGKILTEPRGEIRENYGCDSVVTFDGVHTIAELYSQPNQSGSIELYEKLFRKLTSH